MWSSWNSHKFLVGVWNGITTLETSSTVSYKVNHILTMRPTILHLLLFWSWSFINFYLTIYFEIFYCFYKRLFILRERERESSCTSEGGAVRGGERIPNSLLTFSTEPDAGLDVTNREIMIWAEIKNQTLNRLSHPGIPNTLKKFFFLFLLKLLFIYLFIYLLINLFIYV